MLNNTTDLEYTFNKWLKQNYFDTQAELSTDFAYSEENDTIYFGLFIPTISQNVWEKLLIKWGLEKDYGTFVTCFLHELGHAETLCVATEFERKFSDIMKVLIKAIPIKSLQNYIYYNLPVERLATFWAIEYMNENPKKVEKLRMVAEKTIYNFLEKNNYEN